MDLNIDEYLSLLKQRKQLSEKELIQICLTVINTLLIY